MSEMINDPKSSDTDRSAQYWKDAITYGEQLLAAAKGKRRRARLTAAIERFKQRLESNALYPGLPL